MPCKKNLLALTTFVQLAITAAMPAPMASSATLAVRNAPAPPNPVTSTDLSSTVPTKSTDGSDDSAKSADGHSSATAKTTETTTAPKAADDAPTPKASDNVSAPKTADGAPAPKATDSTSAPKVASGTMAPKSGDNASEPRTTEGAPAPKAADGAPAPKATDSTSAPKVASGTMAPKSGDNASEPKTTEGAPAPKAADEAPTPKTTDGAPAHKAADSTTTPKTADAVSTPKASDSNSTPKVADSVSTPKATDGTAAPKSNGDSNSLASQTEAPKAIDSSPSSAVLKNAQASAVSPKVSINTATSDSTTTDQKTVGKDASSPADVVTGSAAVVATKAVDQSVKTNTDPDATKSLPISAPHPKAADSSDQPKTLDTTAHAAAPPPNGVTSGAASADSKKVEVNIDKSNTANHDLDYHSTPSNKFPDATAVTLKSGSDSAVFKQVDVNIGKASAPADNTNSHIDNTSKSSEIPVITSESDVTNSILVTNNVSSNKNDGHAAKKYMENVNLDKEEVTDNDPKKFKTLTASDSDVDSPGNLKAILKEPIPDNAKPHSVASSRALSKQGILITSLMASVIVLIA